MFIILQQLFARNIITKRFLRSFLSFYCLHLPYEVENYILKTETWFYYDQQYINFRSLKETHTYIYICRQLIFHFKMKSNRV